MSDPAALPATIAVTVLADFAEAAELLASLLTSEPGMRARACVMSAGGVESALHGQPAAVVVTDVVGSPAPLVEALDAVAPSTPVIAILPPGDVVGAQECTLAGARATLLKPVERGDLARVVRQVVAKETRRKQHAAATLAASAAQGPRPGVIAIHGAKGGVGTTTIACNLAAALHRLTGQRVASIDGDVLAGGAGVLFDMAMTRTMADLLPHLDELDAELVNALLPQHPSGVRVLFAPEHWQEAEAIGPSHVKRLLETLRAYFDFQVVDTASYVTSATVAALEVADAVALVVTPEVAALRSASRFLQLTTRLGYPPERVWLVANRANAGNDITTAVIEEYLQRPISLALPSDGLALVECLNAGDLVVTARPHIPVSLGLTQLASDLARSLGWEPPVAGLEAAAPAGPVAALRRLATRLASNGRAAQPAPKETAPKPSPARLPLPPAGGSALRRAPV